MWVEKSFVDETNFVACVVISKLNYIYLREREMRIHVYSKFNELDNRM